MKQLLNDIKMLFLNNWKVLLIILLTVLFVDNYIEIKAGLIDGWNNNK